MAARILDGKALADKVKRELGERLARHLAATGERPGLSVVLVGDNPASEVYVRNKGREAERLSMRSETLRLDTSASTDTVLKLVAELNRRPDVDGILVQLPLAAGVDRERVVEAIDPCKDVDGFHPLNVGNLVLGRPGFVPCTPAGIMALLASHEIEVAGREVVVVGRSEIVGKPLVQLLIRAHATVTVCHSRTRDLESVTRRAEILVAAMGKPAFITDRHVRSGAVVVDVGTSTLTDLALARDCFADDAARLEAFASRGQTLIGDVHPARVRAVAGWLSPVPGGVGPLTIAFLLRNTVQAFEQARGLEQARAVERA
jgi:methylenetetrahydrofolate dehydrogenase (NADP+)/methenyltetrahydrofolate cyclohydrolase